MPFCISCGKDLPASAKFCTSCGTAVESAFADQPACSPANQPVQPESAFTAQPCQPVEPDNFADSPHQSSSTIPAAQPVSSGEQAYGQRAANTTVGTKNKLVAGLLALFLGGLGIHKFYLGYTKEGVIMLLVSVIGAIVTFGIASLVMCVIAFIEGILYLTKSDQDFCQTYEIGNKPWF